MNQELIGLLFAVLLVGTTTAVLMLMADIARPTPQGGRTAVLITYATGEPPVVRASSRTLTARYRTKGRHRR